jgi:anthranilate phosphoribosyltransferase
MHGSNAFSTGQSTADGLASLGLTPSCNSEQAAASLDRIGFAYLPIEMLSPAIARLLALRRLFGLRSPVNTVARLLDPARAPAGVDGVFHPAYINLHLGAAERLDRKRLLVLKGGGGEAERVPIKPGLAHLWVAGMGRSELTLPAVNFAANSYATDDRELLAKVWQGEALPSRTIASVHATIALALLATGHTADVNAAQHDAKRIWRARKW